MCPDFRWSRVDWAVAYLRLNTLVSLIRESILIYFLVLYLTPEQQGIWYTFNSLGVLTIFADLGFADLISQQVASIYARLEWKNQRITGSQYCLDQLFSLIRYGIRLYMGFIPVTTVLLTIGGYYFFKTESLEVFGAFLLFSLIKGIHLFVSLLQSIYQGFDKIADVQENMLKSSLIFSAATVASLVLGLNIWAIVIGNCVNVTLLLYFLYKKAPGFWMQLVRHKMVHRFTWNKKLLPVQARYGLNAISSYLAFNLYVPAVYKVEGAAVAGKLGLTLSIIGAASNISTAWVRSKFPTFSILVANRRRNELHKLLRESFVRICSVYFLSCISILSIVYVINVFEFYNERVLSVPILALMFLYYAEIIIATPWTFYLRAHGDEPWYRVSVTYAILITTAIFTVLPVYGLTGLIISINFINWFILLPLGAMVFLHFRRRYDSADILQLPGSVGR